MRNLNLDYLRAFVDVIELGSFSAAAERLNLSQPAVSLQIRQLEKRVGVSLIERVGRKARPTAAGAELLEHAGRDRDQKARTVTMFDLVADRMVAATVNRPNDPEPPAEQRMRRIEHRHFDGG